MRGYGLNEAHLVRFLSVCPLLLCPQNARGFVMRGLYMLVTVDCLELHSHAPRGMRAPVVREEVPGTPRLGLNHHIARPVPASFRQSLILAWCIVHYPLN